MEKLIYLDDIGLNTRVRNRLKMAKINTVNELQNYDKSKILKIRGIGEWAIQELIVTVEKECNIHLF